ncbi:MAG: cadmium-translocating P-type ATPase [Methylobacterium sp.]|nr:cadmium-translocating P-type ATPase [Methylobacterium sp.]MCA3638082.1 cadmium-translocating P-type ATPase [Methylobacterium sp.]
MSTVLPHPDIRDFSHYLIPAPEDRMRMDFVVDGIHCAACAARIERAFASEPDMALARVNLTEKRLTVEWKDAGRVDPPQVLARLEALGFTGYPFRVAEREASEKAEEQRLLRALGVAGFAMMNIMLLSVSVWSGNETGLSREARDFFHWISALIALPTAAYSGRPFFDSAIRSLKARAVNMDVPISLGILLALGISVWETLQSGEHAYFDGAVMLIFFLLIGRVLDQMMMRRTRAVASNLAALRAETVTRILPDGVLKEVAAATVEPGQLVLVRPGERIGVDGLIERGTSDIDQSLVTGETAHQAVQPGMDVHAGTMNLSGSLEIRVRHASASTLLARIEALLAHATEKRAGYVRLADRAARAYAPVVHTAAALTFIGWVLWGLSWQSALLISVTVLIITCPCALGLAIPAVQVVASGAMFRRSILLHAGDALERLAEVDTVVFDKTGTLTLPEPVIANRKEIPDRLLTIAGRLALSSRHPLAVAIAKAGGADNPFRDVRETPGQGLEAEDTRVKIRLGSPAFCGAEAEAKAVSEAYPEASLIAMRCGTDVAVFAIRQPLRADARATIEALKGLGLSVEILSGDREIPVASVAKALGIDHWHASVEPGGKVARLEELRQQGRKVLMVGDGINDAPALAAAHVSISPVSATDLAQAQADLLVMGASLGPVADAIRIARKARRLMTQNLWLAVIYNAVAVPIAIAGLATPFVAAIAMSGSSLIVTMNAMRARFGGESP